MIVRRILLINAILLGVIIILSYQLYSGWQAYEDSRPLERLVARVSGQPQSAQLPEYNELGNLRQRTDFYSIAENDLFHPDRRPPEIADEEAGRADAPKFPKNPEMQGVIESQGEKKALITVYDNNNSTSGESRIVGINDTVQGWTVSEITDTTTILTWNELSEVIDVFGSKSGTQAASKPAQSGKSSINIVTIGSRQSVVETTTVEPATPGEPELGSSKPSSTSRVISTVGSGRFSSRPAALPRSRPGSNPE